jgi:hypothetical protein
LLLVLVRLGEQQFAVAPPCSCVFSFALALLLVGLPFSLLVRSFVASACSLLFLAFVSLLVPAPSKPAQQCARPWWAARRAAELSTVQAWPLALPAAHADQQPSRAPERSPIPLLSFRSRGQSAPVGSGVFSWQKILDSGIVAFCFIW